ncbi:MAG: hypothetical protein JMN24_14520, partial [gamma proteobacterium endosymbiont of Lamellibrachia anaximandri]|nr:hypothetical protein [gamma proteobacterium endosymbiont of Lamellibrachia anaximandri]
MHVSRTRMPEGRADLYGAIIELYLVRQESNRRRRYTLSGGDVPHWPEDELRLALGHLAWRSQQRSDEHKEKETEDRRIVWSREEMVETIEQLLDGDDFVSIDPDQAGVLLDYYLHPAGLLVEPAEGKIQFAHLSFQEFLCAEHLLGLAGAKGILKFTDQLKKELFANLGQPGWDEVALLLMVLYAEQTQKRGHLELFCLLDPTRTTDASFFYKAYIGDELPWRNRREAWLGYAFGLALLHPTLKLAELLQQRTELAAAGKQQFMELLKTRDDEELWQHICRPVNGFNITAQERLQELGEQRWANPQDDESWDVSQDLKEAHSYRCQPWRAKRRLVVPGSREAALLTRRALRQRGSKVGIRARRPV